VKPTHRQALKKAPWLGVEQGWKYPIKDAVIAAELPAAAAAYALRRDEFHRQRARRGRARAAGWSGAHIPARPRNSGNTLR
jgi:hypothetical protein